MSEFMSGRISVGGDLSEMWARCWARSNSMSRVSPPEPWSWPSFLFPNIVSTLRGSYGSSKGGCLIRMLTLGCGIIPVNVRRNRSCDMSTCVSTAHARTNFGPRFWARHFSAISSSSTSSSATLSSSTSSATFSTSSSSSSSSSSSPPSSSTLSYVILTLPYTVWDLLPGYLFTWYWSVFRVFPFLIWCSSFSSLFHFSSVHHCFHSSFTAAILTRDLHHFASYG